MTPHINAKIEDIAKTVLMPGDPLRAKYIANNYLKDIKLVSNVRNVLIFTGTYNDKKITIASSGMGQPSIGIYSYELFKFYNVENIIRVGSCGSYKEEIKLYDIILAKSAYSDSTSFSKLMIGKEQNISFPSLNLNEKIKEKAKKLKLKIRESRVHSSDVFYSSRPLNETISITKSDVVEMEAAALFITANFFKKNASTILTVSDNLITKELTTSKERETSFDEMIKIALEMA